MKKNFCRFPSSWREAAEALKLTKLCLSYIQEDGLNILECRGAGQGYDNAANMMGIHSEGKQKNLQLNPKAAFIPCPKHNLRQRRPFQTL